MVSNPHFVYQEPKNTASSQFEIRFKLKKVVRVFSLTARKRVLYYAIIQHYKQVFIVRKEPLKRGLVKKILDELKRNSECIWIRKLSRNLNEPVATVYKYVIRDDYCGKYVTIERRSQELGGHLMIKLKSGMNGCKNR